MAAPSGAVFFTLFYSMTEKTKLIEGIDYTINSNGDLVFTASYLLKRGHCCQSGCTNCPYGYTEKVDPFVPAEYNDSWESFEIDDEDSDD